MADKGAGGASPLIKSHDVKIQIESVGHGNMRVGNQAFLRSLAHRVSPSSPSHVPSLFRPQWRGGLRCALPEASSPAASVLLRWENTYAEPPSTPSSSLLLSFGFAMLSLLGSSSTQGTALCEPDGLVPPAQSERTSGPNASHSLRQFRDRRPPLPRSDVSPSRHLGSAVMASGLIPRGSRCFPASPTLPRKRQISYLSTMDDLNNAIEMQKNWTSGPIKFSAATSMSNDAPMIVDLTETLDKSKNNPKAGKRNDTNCYWLPSTLNKNDEETVAEVKSIFVNACKSAGCKVGGQYEKKLNSIVFECNRSKFINRENNLKQSRDAYEKRLKKLGVSEEEKPFVQREKRTSKPIKGRAGFDTQCKFRFSAFWDEQSGRWYIPKEQKGCRDHAGHMREVPSNIRVSSKFLGTREQRQNRREVRREPIVPRTKPIPTCNATCHRLEIPMSSRSRQFGRGDRRRSRYPSTGPF